MLAGWRRAWAEHQNKALGRAGYTARVDHRSLAKQRAEALHKGDRKLPATLRRAPEVHVGPKVSNAVGLRPESKVRKTDRSGIAKG
ncbi:hypothetical protein XH80_19845 [Bradyrhizobium sp. CCBAU 45384]|nr:hypothetical protein [Bradyrhizobium sp. CCBAU 45384]